MTFEKREMNRIKERKEENENGRNKTRWKEKSKC